MGDAKGWRNRIVGEGVKPASQFLAHPLNWRTHPQFQRDALRGSLNEVGWVQRVIENVRTGHLIDGHERVWQALDNDDADVPFVQVGLSEEEELQVLATLDPISALAGADAQALDDLLEGVSTEDEAISELLHEIRAEAELDLWLSEQLAAGPGGDGAGRRLGDRKAQIKPVIYAEDLGTFEQAILLTGNPNRGEALIEICEHYLKDYEEG